MVRLRLSQVDAHYGGALVDGARILALFGDVATELLIRLDGDEGLFRAYDAVEFLAPVRAGDFLEVTGEITREHLARHALRSKKGDRVATRPFRERRRGSHGARRGMPRERHVRRAAGPATDALTMPGLGGPWRL